MGQQKCAAGGASKLLQHRDKKNFCGEGRVKGGKRKRENLKTYELWAHVSWVVSEIPADLTEPTHKTEFLHSGSYNIMKGKVLEVMCAVPRKNLSLTITRVGVLNGMDMKGDIPNGVGEKLYGKHRVERVKNGRHPAVFSFQFPVEGNDIPTALVATAKVLEGYDDRCFNAKNQRFGTGKRLVTRKSTRQGEMETFYYSKCEHGKQESQCAECGWEGPEKCEHGQQKSQSQCARCGTGYCVHKRRKHRCRDCGTGLCVHGRWKYQCRDCGTGLCVHGRWKNQCRDCGTGIKKKA
jgi:hypothetical protein